VVRAKLPPLAFSVHPSSIVVNRLHPGPKAEDEGRRRGRAGLRYDVIHIRKPWARVIVPIVPNIRYLSAIRDGGFSPSRSLRTTLLQVIWSEMYVDSRWLRLVIVTVVSAFVIITIFSRVATIVVVTTTAPVIIRIITVRRFARLRS
jgi:hypothetical protein